MLVLVLVVDLLARLSEPRTTTTTSTITIRFPRLAPFVLVLVLVVDLLARLSEPRTTTTDDHDQVPASCPIRARPRSRRRFARRYPNRGRRRPRPRSRSGSRVFPHSRFSGCEDEEVKRDALLTRKRPQNKLAVTPKRQPADTLPQQLSTQIKFPDMVVVQKIRGLACQSDPPCFQRISSIRNFKGHA